MICYGSQEVTFAHMPCQHSHHHRTCTYREVHNSEKLNYKSFQVAKFKAFHNTTVFKSTKDSEMQVRLHIQLSKNKQSGTWSGRATPHATKRTAYTRPHPLQDKSIHTRMDPHLQKQLKRGPEYGVYSQGLSNKYNNGICNGFSKGMVLV